MSETQASVVQWQRDTFGPTTPERAVGRIALELCELTEALSAGRFADAERECADVQILLYALAEAIGSDLGTAVNAKMQVNRARTWARDATGHWQHE